MVGCLYVYLFEPNFFGAYIIQFITTFGRVGQRQLFNVSQLIKIFSDRQILVWYHKFRRILADHNILVRAGTALGQNNSKKSKSVVDF